MLSYSPEKFNNRMTRGGPLTIEKPGWDANVFLNTDNRKKWVFGLETSYFKNESGEWYREIDFEVEWRKELLFPNKKPHIVCQTLR